MGAIKRRLILLVGNYNSLTMMAASAMEVDGGYRPCVSNGRHRDPGRLEQGESCGGGDDRQKNWGRHHQKERPNESDDETMGSRQQTDKVNCKAKKKSQEKRCRRVKHFH